VKEALDFLSASLGWLYFTIFINMQLAQITTNGQKQILTLPMDIHFPDNSVYIQRVGNAVLLVPQDKQWEVFLSGLNRFSSDFMENGREQGTEEAREEI
jgi:antitoxin VapB